MALTKQDKEDIGQIIDEKVTKIVDEKINSVIDMKVPVIVQSIVTKEIGFLRLEMNQRFDAASIENKSEHREIIQKIEQVKQMETEDIQVLYRDVAILKKKAAV